MFQSTTLRVPWSFLLDSHLCGLRLELASLCLVLLVAPDPWALAFHIMHCGVAAGWLKVRDTLEESKLVNVGITSWLCLLAGCSDEEGWLCACGLESYKAYPLFLGCLLRILYTLLASPGLVANMRVYDLGILSLSWRLDIWGSLIMQNLIVIKFFWISFPTLPHPQHNNCGLKTQLHSL